MNITLSALLALESHLPILPSHPVMRPPPATKSQTQKMSQRSDLLTEATSIWTPNPTRPDPNPRSGHRPSWHVTGLQDITVRPSPGHHQAGWEVETWCVCASHALTCPWDGGPVLLDTSWVLVSCFTVAKTTHLLTDHDMCHHIPSLCLNLFNSFD